MNSIQLLEMSRLLKELGIVIKQAPDRWYTDRYIFMPKGRRFTTQSIDGTIYYTKSDAQLHALRYYFMQNGTIEHLIKSTSVTIDIPCNFGNEHTHFQVSIAENKCDMNFITLCHNGTKYNLWSY